MNKGFLPLVTSSSSLQTIIKQVLKNYSEEYLESLIKLVYFIHEAPLSGIREKVGDTSNTSLADILLTLSSYWVIRHEDFYNLDKVVTEINLAEEEMPSDELLTTLVRLYNIKYPINKYAPDRYNYMTYVDPKKILSDIPKYINVYSITKGMPKYTFNTKEKLATLVLEGVFNKKDKIGVRYVETD